MIRFTRKVFADLALWMIGLGLLMGVIFPFFAYALGLPGTHVFQFRFFAACMTAGFIVGGANILLARMVVGQRLKTLADRMRYTGAHLQVLSNGKGFEGAAPGQCLVPADSDDELGESATAFNQLVEALASSLRTENAVRAFTEMLASQLDLKPLAEKALGQLLEYTHASAGAVLIEARGDLKIVAAMNIREPEKVAQSDHVRRVLRTGRMETVAVPEGVAMDGVLTDFRPSEIIVDPVLYKGDALGALILTSTKGFSPKDLHRIDLFRQGLALAIHNALIHERLEKLAAVDPLTNIYNRRFGLGRLHEEFQRAVRAQSPLGLVMFDIDHFKNVNDTYGHLMGDRVLASVAKVTRGGLREGDVLIRYGGEEFLAILPAAAKQDVHKVGERLRRLVEETSIVEGDQRIRVTISVGGTAYPEADAEGENAFIARVDAALYRAKDTGRNRVVID